MSKIELFNECNMQVMKRYPDGYFSLAIVDPPYGIGESGGSNHSRDRKAKATRYTAKDWDKTPPPPEYFTELRRISKHQIIWGANHFISRIPIDSPCWVVWDKDNSGDFADCELALTSFPTAVRKFKFRWNGMLQEDMKNKEERIHPTQKPIALYDWLLKQYATPDMRIIDTHGGSFNSAIAMHKFGIKEAVICEIDKEYYDNGVHRYHMHTNALYKVAHTEKATGQKDLFAA